MDQHETSMMADRLAIGLIGCGRWGRHILRDLVSLGCDVSVVARSAASHQRAADGEAARIVTDIAELPVVRGVVVASPTSTHGDVIESLLSRGVPIFTEKPLTADVASAQRIAKQAADRVFVMDKWRYHPGIELLASIARSGELGPVLGLRTRRVNWGNPHGDVDGVWILAPHDLSIALEVLGILPAPRSAVATHCAGLATGLIAILGESPWCHLEVSTLHRDWERDFWLYCQDGVAVLDDAYGDHVRITRAAEPGDTRSPELERRPISTEMPLLRELRAFVEHLRGGPPPRSSAAEGLAIVETLDTLRSLAGLSDQRAAA